MTRKEEIILEETEMRMLRRIIGVTLREETDYWSDVERRKGMMKSERSCKCVSLQRRQGRIGSDGLDNCTERMMENKQKTSFLQ